MFATQVDGDDDTKAWANCLQLMKELAEAYADGSLTKVELKPKKKELMRRFTKPPRKPPVKRPAAASPRPESVAKRPAGAEPAKRPAGAEPAAPAAPAAKLPVKTGNKKAEQKNESENDQEDEEEDEQEGDQEEGEEGEEEAKELRLRKNPDPNKV